MSTQHRVLSGFSMYTTELVRLVDLVCVVFAGAFAFWLRFGYWDMPERYVWGITLGGLLTLLVLPNFSIYRSWRGQVRVVLVFKLCSGYLVVGSLLALVMFLSKTGANFSRLWIGYWLIGAASCSILARALAYPVLNQLRAKGSNRKSVLLIGDALACSRALRQLNKVPSAGFDVKRVLLTGAEKGAGSLDAYACEYYVPGASIKHDEEEVWICLPLSSGELVRQIQSALSFSTGNVRFMPDMRDLRLINHDVSDVAGLFMLDLSCSPMSFGGRFIKFLEDRLLALLIVLISSPLMLVVAIGIKATSSGPILYRQERVGLNGKPFMMLKFRSMPVDVEKAGVCWGGAKQKKTTRFGSFLRRTSLDELPQFLNVLKGDMSIVGPRPERTLFVEKLKHDIPGYMQKHMVKAGITGWAQINGWRGDTDLQKRIECDLWYVENWSFWLDMKIIFITFFKGFVNKNAY